MDEQTDMFTSIRDSKTYKKYTFKLLLQTIM